MAINRQSGAPVYTATAFQNDSLLGKWTVPNDDGTYDIYDTNGSRAYENVTKSFALMIARRMEAGRR